MCKCHRLSLLLAVVTSVSVFGCSSKSLDMHAAEEQAIHDSYNAWVEAANEKDIAKWSTFLAENPYFSPADAPPLTSTKAVINYYKNSFSDSRFSLDCEQQEVEISESSEMAWARGICNATFAGPDGKKASGTSRWFKVWIKQPDGSWRGRVNTWKYENQP